MSDLLPVLRPQADVIVIVDPETGEAMAPIDAPDDLIARWRRRVLDLEAMLRQAKKEVDAVVIARMDADCLWTRRAGGFILSASSPAPSTEYPDPEALFRDLCALEGLTDDAVERAVRPVTVYKPQAGGIKKLRALGREDVDAVLDRHGEQVEKERRVTVKEA